jgi:oligosaccharide repeat unit polymerase
MKSVLIIVSLIICLILIYLKNKTFFNISGIFVLFWGLCATFASFSLYGMYEISYTTTLLIVAAMYIFTVVGLAFPPFNKRNISLNNLKDSEKGERTVVLSNGKLITSLNLAAYVFSVPYLIKAINIIRNQGFEFLRTYAFVGSTQFASTRALTIFQYIVSPLFIATMIVTAIDISLKKRAVRGIIMTFIGTALYTVLFGGRYMMFQAVLIFLMAYYINSKGSISSFIRNNKKIVIIVAAAIIGMIVITSLRPSGGLIRSIYIYFCGSFKYLDTLLEDDSFVSMRLGGIATFGFIYDFILTIMVMFFGVSPYHGANYQITQITGSSRRIGDGLRYNSLGTMYTAFIADFGIWMSIIGVLIFAILVCWMQKKFERTPTYYDFACYLFALYTIINAVLSYSFLKFSIVVLFVFLALFTGKIRLKSGTKIYIEH